MAWWLRIIPLSGSAKHKTHETCSYNCSKHIYCICFYLETQSSWFHSSVWLELRFPFKPVVCRFFSLDRSRRRSGMNVELSTCLGERRPTSCIKSYLICFFLKLSWKRAPFAFKESSELPDSNLKQNLINLSAGKYLNLPWQSFFTFMCMFLVLLLKLIFANIKWQQLMCALTVY